MPRGMLPGALRRLPGDLTPAQREFLDELRRVYRRTGLTMRQLEAELHVSDSAWSRYLNGATPIPDEPLRGLARAAGLRRGEWLALVALRDRTEETVIDLTAEAPEGAATAPRQLPAAATSFTGRDGAFHWLDEMAAGCGSPGAVPVLVVDGSAGVGKTALVVSWAHRVAARFPAGQLFLDLQGHAAARAPVTPAVALAQMLRALGVAPAAVPAELDELAAAYRSLVADQRLLIVLDNAASADQVRPLIPGGARCVVVVTTRFALTGLAATHGARHYELACMPEPEAVSLLQALLRTRTADPAETAGLARQCAYLPLALRVAVARLETEAHLCVRDLAARMASGGPLDALTASDTAVRSAFDMSYEHLSSEDRRTFRLLATVPGPDVAVDTVAALLDRVPATAAASIGRLAAAHLAEEHTAGRFRQHDLLRAYAAERQEAEDPPADRVAARRRLYETYLSRVAAAAELIAPGTTQLPGAPPPAAFPDPAAALAWTKAEERNLVAAVVAADDVYAWLLADALRAYFRQHGDGASWLATARHGLAAASAAGDAAGEAAMRVSLGQASWRRGNFFEALDYLE